MDEFQNYIAKSDKKKGGTGLVNIHQDENLDDLKELLVQLPLPSHFDNLHVTYDQCKKKQGKLEEDRTKLARIWQMLIDELNECEGRVRVAEAVIGDLKKSGIGDSHGTHNSQADNSNGKPNPSLIEVITKLQEYMINEERIKDKILEEMDKSKQLDQDLMHQDREIDKLETFINSPNGLNQEKVEELQHEIQTQDETIVHLLEVIGMVHRSFKCLLTVFRI